MQVRRETVDPLLRFLKTLKMYGVGDTVNSFLWAMTAIYLFAFASLYAQIPGLYGKNGILPASLFLDEELSRSGSNAPRLVGNL